jgi:Protein of unknown function (DUF998)
MQYISEPSSIVERSDMPFRWQKGLQSPATFGLVSCGAIGAFLFTVTYLLKGIARPGYDAWQQPISALSLGPGGWVQQVNFVVFGILTLLSAFGWYRLLTPGRYAIWFPLFQGIGGLCLIGAGMFSMDAFPGYPPGAAPALSTVHGSLHSILAWVLILTLAMGCFTLAKRFARAPHWRGWAVYSVITGVLILIFWEAFVQSAFGTVAGLVPLAGLVERLSAGSHALWMCVLVVTLFLKKGASVSIPENGTPDASS